MTRRDLPDYLRPVPGQGDAGAAATASEPGEEQAAGMPGLTPPMNRGRSGAFITDAIAELGYASREQVDQAVAQARTAERPAETLLLEQGLISPEQLSRATAERYGLDYADLGTFQVDMAAANLISLKSARRHHVVPIARVNEQTVMLAMADPANVLALDDVQMGTGMNVQ